MTDAEGLHTPTLVANCVLNGFLSYTAIVLNIITIQALRKTSSLPKTLKTLLLSLSISDLGVGLLVQPLYVAHMYLTMETTKNIDSIAYWAVYKAYAIPSSLFVFASFFGVFAITVDRFLAIHLHNLRYQKLVTHKRVVAVVISFWVFSVIACFWYESISVLSVMSVVCIITTGLLYCKIYAAVRHHTNQIHALQVQQVTQNGDMANTARLRKTSVATFYVYILFSVCYLPIACAGLATMIHGKNAFLSHLWLFTLTVVYLNSSFNPLIYSWKMRHIRQAVLDRLRNVCPRGH